MSASAEEHRRYSPHHLGFAVITVSDSRTPETDTGGATVRELAAAAGHRVLGADLVRDEIPAIRQAVEAILLSTGIDVLVLTGGTGVSPRDVTVAAVTPLFERPIEGFGELFRMLSYEQIGAAAMLSRATAGLIDGRAVFLLPGSPGAVALAMEKLILPEAAHLLGQARRR
jgi:molybdenum cofactor biosynthesis protein B